MKNQLERNAGTSLIIGAILAVITMVLHPVGGDIDHLIKISTVIIASHTIALFSVPFLTFGFWGLSRRIGMDNTMSVLAFITSGLGMIAVMLAGAINGLVVPFFVDSLETATPEKLEMSRVVLSYGFSLNHAFDYIFIGAICEAFLLYSIAIFKNRIFPKWIAFLGIGLGLGFLIMLVSGFLLIDLHGFRIFIFGIVLWIISVGVMLRKKS